MRRRRLKKAKLRSADKHAIVGCRTALDQTVDQRVSQASGRLRWCWGVARWLLLSVCCPCTLILGRTAPARTSLRGVQAVQRTPEAWSFLTVFFELIDSLLVHGIPGTWMISELVRACMHLESRDSSHGSFWPEAGWHDLERCLLHACGTSLGMPSPQKAQEPRYRRCDRAPQPDGRWRFVLEHQP